MKNVWQLPIPEGLVEDLQDGEIILVLTDKDGKPRKVATNSYHVEVTLVPTISIFDDPWESPQPISEFNLNEIVTIEIRRGEANTRWLRKQGKFDFLRLEDSLEAVPVPSWICPRSHDLALAEIAKAKAELLDHISEEDVDQIAEAEYDLLSAVLAKLDNLSASRVGDVMALVTRADQSKAARRLISKLLEGKVTPEEFLVKCEEMLRLVRQW